LILFIRDGVRVRSPRPIPGRLRMVIWALAKKELRLLLRDRLSAGILLGMPLFFILVLGLLLGEGFGQKADDRLRVSVVDLDEGYYYALKSDDLPRGAAGTLGLLAAGRGAGPWAAASALAAEHARAVGRFPSEPWARVVLRDLRET